MKLAPYLSARGCKWREPVLISRRGLRTIFSVSIPLTVPIIAKRRLYKISGHDHFEIVLTGFGLRILDFEDIYKPTTDKTRQLTNMVKTVEMQDFFQLCAEMVGNRGLTKLFECETFGRRWIIRVSGSSEHGFCYCEPCTILAKQLTFWIPSRVLRCESLLKTMAPKLIFY